MSSLTYNERRSLERLLQMESGYVLDFTNRTFQDFIQDTVGRDIYAERYDFDSGSKANRLRAFWQKEPDHLVAKLLVALVDFAAELGRDRDLVDSCRGIVARLLQAAPVADIDAIEPNADRRDFEVVASAVRKHIEHHEPEVGLDRLHTFTTKYLRVLCEKRGIATPKEKPLHSLLGELIKALKAEGLIESAMSERILKSSISLLEALNPVRNEKSLAHDNELLAYNEALLIFNSVASVIRFLSSIEQRPATMPDENADIPF